MMRPKAKRETKERSRRRGVYDRSSYDYGTNLPEVVTLSGQNGIDIAKLVNPRLVDWRNPNQFLLVYNRMNWRSDDSRTDVNREAEIG